MCLLLEQFRIFDLTANCGAGSFSVTVHRASWEGWTVEAWAVQVEEGIGMLCYRLDIAIFVRGFVKAGVTGRPCQAGCA